MGREIRVPITPGVLAWALETSGYDISSVAHGVGVETDLVHRWLSGEECPTLTRFRAVARVLRRPTATFLLPGPPKSEPPQIEFRPPPGESSRKLHPEELRCIREAERLQRAVAWITSEIGQETQPLPSVRPRSSPESAAATARRLLAVLLEEQLAWLNESEALKRWREALEGLGVLVFLLPIGANAARGFSIWHEASPLIAVNTHWNSAARIFTLLHELGHLLTRTNSICAQAGSRLPLPGADTDVERWCERFAAAVLMPESAVLETLVSLGIPSDDRATSLEVAKKVSRRFKVSLRAATLRLISIGRASWDLYTLIPATSDARSGGGGGGRNRLQVRIDEYGRRTARVFLHGLQNDVIDASEVMRYLDISYRNLEELESLAS
jgi:Zn-dependent peptidase ImmA (M78 family)